MFNSSMTFEDAKSNKNPETAAVLAERVIDETEEEKKELHFDYDDDIVN
jgi:hypothetical protein